MVPARRQLTVAVSFHVWRSVTRLCQNCSLTRMVPDDKVTGNTIIESTRCTPGPRVQQREDRTKDVGRDNLHIGARCQRQLQVALPGLNEGVASWRECPANYIRNTQDSEP